MIKKLFVFTSMLAVGTLFFLTSCSENVLNETSVENYVDESVARLHDEGGCGRGGCFEFVFPLSIDFPDGTTGEYEDYETLRDAIKTWKEDNPDAEDKPSLAFPLEVISQDGEVISIADRSELRRLRARCIRNFIRNKIKRGKERCFKVVFPLTVEFPEGTTDSETTEVADRRELKQLIRRWKHANPDVDERPSVVFPITVELEDGSTQEIADRDELQALKESCSQDAD